MNMTVLSALKERRSIRSFRPEQVKKETLDLVLEAGTYAATGNGSQSPLIVAVQDAGMVAKLVRMNAAVLGSDANPYYGAPTIVLVFAPKTKNTYIEDGSLVLGNLMLAAYAAGFGACWIHREREMFESEEGKQLMKAWGIPAEFAGIGSIALGYPAGEAPAPAPRKEGYIIRV